jgi:hypothetical protein
MPIIEFFILNLFQSFCSFLLQFWSSPPHQLHQCPEYLSVTTQYSLTHSWSWALHDKLPILQLLKNYPAFYGTRRFIAVLTRALQWSLSWAKWIESIPSHPITLRSILILSTHLRLGLPSGLFASGFPTNILYAFLFPPFVLHVLPISSSLTWLF